MISTVMSESGTRREHMSTSEHILLEGDELDITEDIAATRAPQQHFHVTNRSHANQTEMILFEGGWLSLRHHRRNKPGVARMINLRFVDPKPTITRHFAKRTLLASLILGAAGAIAAALAWYSVAVIVSVPASILLFTASAVFFVTCAYRTRKDVVFFTRTGQAPVIELMATLGSFRALRQIVPKLVAAIEISSIPDEDRQKQLRLEMREHYRLREGGVLTQSECTDSTQRILRQFK